MRKSLDDMVSLNPEYGIEVTKIADLAERVKDTNPELYSILTITVASILAKDEKKLVKYCNTYLTDVIYNKKLKDQLSDLLGGYETDGGDHKPPHNWDF
jgi:hypothetical protein